MKKNHVAKVMKYRGPNAAKEKARDRYEEKPYVETRFKLFMLANGSKGTLHTLSVVFGFLFVFSLCFHIFLGKELAKEQVDALFELNLSGAIIIASIVAMVILVLVEVAKSRTVGQLFWTYFSEERKPVGLVVLSAFLVCLSIGFSVKGGHTLSKVRTPTPTLLDVEGIKTKYEADILALNDENRQIMSGDKRYTWKGTIIEKWQDKVEANTSQINKLKQEKANEVMDARAENAKAMARQSMVQFGSSTWFMLLAFLNEIGCVLAMYYREEYLYKVFVEEEEARGNAKISTKNSNKTKNSSSFRGPYNKDTGERIVEAHQEIINSGGTPSIQELAKISGFSDRTVSKYVNEIGLKVA